MSVGRLATFLARWWVLLLAGPLVAALGAMIFVQRATPIYEATSTVVVSRPTGAPGVDDSAGGEALARTYAENITSRTVMDQAARRIGIDNPNTQALQQATRASTVNGTPLRVGTAPRTLPTTRGPMYISEKLRISKRFYLGGENRFLEVGASMTNPLNRTVPYVQDTTVGDAAFGTLLLGGGDRVMQLNARIEF